MKTIIIAFLTLLSFSSFAQKSDTVTTIIKFGANNMLRLKQLETNQRKYDSLIRVQQSEILDVILSSHNIELKDVIKIEPKPNGEFVIKTKKK